MPLRIAIVASDYRPLSPARQIGDRFLTGYPLRGRWHRPDVRVVSLYVDRKQEGDLSAARAKEFGFGVFGGVAEALRCGGDRLAADAVIATGEPGGAPPDEFFWQCVEVFEKDGRSVPVYCGDRLSSSFEKAKWMVDQARRLKFPLLAGSSLPLTWRLPEVDLPSGAVVEEALVAAGGGTAPLDYAALECMQAMVERRKGGEAGVRSVQAVEGEAVWKAGEAGRYSRDLLASALSRSDTPQGLTLKDGRTQDLLGTGELRGLAREPVACFIEHTDGLRTTLLMLNGAISDVNFAARVKGHGILSTQFLRTPAPYVSHSARLAARIEEMLSTGRAPYPAERTLLAGGALEAALKSREQGEKRLETPHLAVRYRAAEPAGRGPE